MEMPKFTALWLQSSTPQANPNFKMGLFKVVEVEQFECQVPKSLESKHHAVLDGNTLGHDHHRTLWLNAIQWMFELPCYCSGITLPRQRGGHHLGNLGLGEFGAASSEVLIKDGEDDIIVLQCDATKGFRSKGLHYYFMAIAKLFLEILMQVQFESQRRPSINCWWKYLILEIKNQVFF